MAAEASILANLPNRRKPSAPAWAVPDVPNRSNRGPRTRGSGWAPGEIRAKQSQFRRSLKFQVGSSKLARFAVCTFWQASPSVIMSRARRVQNKANLQRADVNAKCRSGKELGGNHGDRASEETKPICRGRT